MLGFLLNAELDALACQYVPEFGNNGKQSITIRHLLSHTAGLREFYPFFDMGMTQEKEVNVSIFIDFMT